MIALRRALPAWVLLAPLILPATGPAVHPHRVWAPARQASITPGVRTETAGALCTANFVFADAAGRVYIGQAAHCDRVEGKDPGSAPSGCKYESHPLGTATSFPAAGVRGELAYSSYLAMQARRETDPQACRENDFALIRLPESALGKVNPSMPLFGGPTGLNTTGVRPGGTVLGWGDSPTRADVAALQPKQEVAVQDIDDGWAHLVYTTNPGIPGDSGGPALDADGAALGSLSSIDTAHAPLSDNLADIARCLAYAQQHSGIEGLHLVAGTEAFQPSLVQRNSLAGRGVASSSSGS